MPVINLQITRGATPEQKAEIISDFTATLARVLGKKTEHTHIIIQEVEEQDWGFAGLPTDAWRRANAGG